VRCLALKDLIACKRASGRPPDLMDLEFLEIKASLASNEADAGKPME